MKNRGFCFEDTWCVSSSAAILPPGNQVYPRIATNWRDDDDDDEEGKRHRATRWPRTSSPDIGSHLHTWSHFRSADVEPARPAQRIRRWGWTVTVWSRSRQKRGRWRRGGRRSPCGFLEVTREKRALAVDDAFSDVYSALIICALSFIAGMAHMTRVHKQSKLRKS